MWTAVLTLMLTVSLAASDSVGVIPITHGSLILTCGDTVIHIDPWSQGNYTNQPQADLVLITDTHRDHLDPQQVIAVSKAATTVIGPAAVRDVLAHAQTLENGERTRVEGIGIEAVPMYNLKRGPGPGRLYHPKGRGNGYIISCDEERVYISGDTACTDEMKTLSGIDLAFVSMNLPYTMPPEEAAACVNVFKPRVVIPYHHRGSDLETFTTAVTAPEVTVRILEWYPQ